MIVRKYVTNSSLTLFFLQLHTREASMSSYCVEYAKSNRSECKGCHVKIHKGAIRIGYTFDGPGDYQITAWRHLACQKKPAAITSLAGLFGSEAINTSDRPLLLAWLANNSATVMAAKRKADDEAAAVAEEAGPSTPKKLKKGSEPPPTAPRSSPATSSASVSAEKAERDEARAIFSHLSVPALKGCLRSNQQLMSGNKGDLVERCIDRKVYGNLPRCGICGIGRLKVTYERPFGHGGQGTFTCPGGYDDDEYKRCSFRSRQVQRPEWVITEHETVVPSAGRKSGGGKSNASVPLVVD